MKKVIIPVLILIISILLFREVSSVDEYEAKEIAKNLISEKGYNHSCGGKFEKYLLLNKKNPLIVPGIDTSGYTFESNNGRCTLIIYIYKYW